MNSSSDSESKIIKESAVGSRVQIIPIPAVVYDDESKGESQLIHNLIHGSYELGGGVHLICCATPWSHCKKAAQMVVVPIHDGKVDPLNGLFTCEADTCIKFVRRRLPYDTVVLRLKNPQSITRIA
jgi:hypothetical protein